MPRLCCIRWCLELLISIRSTLVSHFPMMTSSSAVLIKVLFTYRWTSCSELTYMPLTLFVWIENGFVKVMKWCKSWVHFSLIAFCFVCHAVPEKTKLCWKMHYEKIRVINKFEKYMMEMGLPDGNLQNTGHWQCQCLWHKILSYLHMHCPVLLSFFLYLTKSQNTRQSG